MVSTPTTTVSSADTASSSTESRVVTLVTQQPFAPSALATSSNLVLGSEVAVLPPYLPRTPVWTDPQAPSTAITATTGRCSVTDVSISLMPYPKAPSPVIRTLDLDESVSRRTLRRAVRDR